MKIITKKYLIDAGAPICVFEDCARVAWDYGLDAEVKDVLNSGRAETCQWIMTMYELDEDEKRLGYDRLDITNSNCVFASRYVDKSNKVFYSQHVESSQDVKHSEYVTESVGIHDSHDVQNSKEIISGSYITDCNKVYQSANVEKSEVVSNCSDIYNCHYIFNSIHVSDSLGIQECENVSNAYFCKNCKLLDGAMFCSDFSGEPGKFYVFNHEVTERTFNRYCDQLKRLSSDLIVFDYPNSSVFLSYNWTQRAMDWISTLPNYNRNIMYSLNFDSSFLI